MMQPGHDILLVLDGELAYIGVDDWERFYVNRNGAISEHDTLVEALLAAAKECGAVP